MRWMLPALVILPLCLAPARAESVRVEAPHVDRVDIYEFGLYQTQMSQKIKDPTAPGGERGTAVNIDLVQQTDKIPAVLEMEFGIRFRFVGGPEDALVPYTLVLRFPEPGLKEPGKKEPTLIYRAQEATYINSDGNYQSYGFDWPWEVVPGTWTFEIWYDGKKMASKNFYIF